MRALLRILLIVVVAFLVLRYVLRLFLKSDTGPVRGNPKKKSAPGSADKIQDADFQDIKK